MVQSISMRSLRGLVGMLIATLSLVLTGCGGMPTLPPAVSQHHLETNYLIGPGDTLNIFVWRNPEVSVTIPVRPDGKISTPLVDDMVASGKTPTQLARDMEKVLSKYIQDPVVTVMVSNFIGPYRQQIRVVGDAVKPQAIAYRNGMTLLDVIISVGGLTEFASGNSATIVRMVDGKQKQFRVRIDDLIKDGDITANVNMVPGDILIIPESWF